MDTPTLDHVSLSVQTCAHKQTTRYAMNGVLVDEKGFTATNGKILAHVTHDGATRTAAGGGPIPPV